MYERLRPLQYYYTTATPSFTLDDPGSFVPSGLADLLVGSQLAYVVVVSPGQRAICYRDGYSVQESTGSHFWLDEATHPLQIRIKKN